MDTPASRAWLAISRPSGLSVSRDTQAVERPRRASADGGVQLRAADLHIEAARLLQAAKVRRTEANHRLAEGDHVIRHGSLRVQGPRARGQKIGVMCSYPDP